MAKKIKTSWDYDTRAMTEAQRAKWKPPVLTEAEKKQMAKTDPWFTYMMNVPLVPFGKTVHTDKPTPKKKGKRALKAIKKYLKENGTDEVVHTPKKLGRPKKSTTKKRKK